MVGELPDPAKTAPSSFASARATRSPCSARSRRRCTARSWRSSAASWSWACRSPTSPRSPRPARRSATPSAPGASPRAHDVSDGGLACALAECCDRRRHRPPRRPPGPARARLHPRGGALRRGHRRLRPQRRPRRARGPRRPDHRRGRRHHDRARRRRPQPDRRRRRRDRGLALAGRAGRIGRRAPRRRAKVRRHAAPRPVLVVALALLVAAGAAEAAQAAPQIVNGSAHGGGEQGEGLASSSATSARPARRARGRR